MIPDRYKGHVVSFRNDRMGARFLSILNAIRIAQDYDLPYAFTWMTHGRSSAELQSPTEIFATDYFNTRVVGRDDFKHINDSAMDLMAMPLGSSAQTLPDVVEDGGAFLCMATDLLVLPWEDREVVATRYAAAIDKLVFSDTIKAAMAAVDDVLADSGTAFHIRRGDIIHDPVTSNQLWSNKYIPREFYEILAKRLIKDPDARILVFSDEPAEIAHLKKLSTQITGPDEVLPKELTLAQRDFMEIYAMSRCQQIMGPPGSGFSIAAGLMGDKSVNDIRDNLTSEEYAAAMSLLVTRLEARSPLFLSDGDIGQSLPFALTYLDEIGQADQGLSLMKRYADGGFYKVYFFKLLMEQYLKTGEYTQCDAVLEKFGQTRLDRAIPARMDMYWSELWRIAGLGAVHAYDTSDLHHRFAMSLWYHPTNRIAMKMLSQLISTDRIDLGQFVLPIDPALKRPAAIPPPPINPVQLSLPALEGTNFVFALEIAVWDWAAYLGKTVVRGFRTPQAIQRARDIFAQQFTRHCPPESVTSAFGVFATALDDLEKAEALQKEALSAQPDNPLFLKRMADVRRKADPKDPIALICLEKAAGLAKPHSLYHADLAMCLLAQGQVERGFEILSDLCAHAHVLPEILFLTARAMRQHKQPRDAALIHATKALETVPHMRRFMQLRTHLLADMKNWDEANQQINKIVELYGDGGDLALLRKRIAA